MSSPKLSTMESVPPGRDTAVALKRPRDGPPQGTAATLGHRRDAPVDMADSRASAEPRRPRPTDSVTLREGLMDGELSTPSALEWPWRLPYSALSVLARFGGRQKGRMMAQLGADVEQLDSLARRFDQEAQTIENTISTITSQIGATWWQGTDADNFRNEWQTNYTASLRNVIQRLQDAASRCRAQANQQRQTSSV